MLVVEDWMDIKELHRQGHSIRAIVELTGYARNTVRRVLREAAPKSFQKPTRRSCLDPFKSYLEQREATARLSAIRLLEELRAQGYTGSIDVLRRFLKQLRANEQRKAKATVRFETPPGHQAQADWAFVGKFPTASGTTLSIYCFVMVLSFSRQLYIEFTTSMALPTLIQCHLHAFSFFGGIPHSMLYDNMKQVKLHPGQWTPLFLDFCSHYGLVPKTHRVRRPRTKGKVERMVSYVQDNFLNGRSFADLDDLNGQGRVWLESVANVRIHQTTQARPLDLWHQEQSALLALTSIAPYQLWLHHERKVDVEGFVRLHRSRYSVPPDYIGKRVVVVEQQRTIVVRCGQVVIAEHPVAAHAGACLTQVAHVEALARLTLQRPSAAVPNLTLKQELRVETTPLSVYEEVS